MSVQSVQYAANRFGIVASNASELSYDGLAAP